MTDRQSRDSREVLQRCSLQRARTRALAVGYSAQMSRLRVATLVSGRTDDTALSSNQGRASRRGTRGLTSDRAGDAMLEHKGLSDAKVCPVRCACKCTRGDGLDFDERKQDQRTLDCLEKQQRSLRRRMRAAELPNRSKGAMRA